MYHDHRVGVVVPAFNEEDLIGPTLQGIPDYVDTIIVVNDASEDRTAERIAERARVDPRIIVITHENNEGLGKSLIDGYEKSVACGCDIAVVMAGDAQMDPNDLPRLLNTITDEGYDYVKGNRLLHRDLKESMPRYRIIGNAVLTILTKFATGYFRLMDPQCGYTAIRTACLRRIPIKSMTRGYGYNADLLNMLNIHSFRVADVEVRPVYGQEKSGIRLWRYIPKVSGLLVRLFFRRLWLKNVILDFHPLVFFYAMAFLLIPLGFWKGAWIFWSEYVRGEKVTEAALIFAALLNITGWQSFFFAVLFDSEYNGGDR